MNAPHTRTNRPEGRPVQNTGRGERSQSTAPAPLEAGVLVALSGDTATDAEAITEAVGSAYAAIIGARLLETDRRPLVLTRGPVEAAYDLAGELGSEAFARSFVARMADELAPEVPR